MLKGAFGLLQSQKLSTKQIAYLTTGGGKFILNLLRQISHLKIFSFKFCKAKFFALANGNLKTALCLFKALFFVRLADCYSFSSSSADLVAFRSGFP